MGAFNLQQLTAAGSIGLGAFSKSLPTNGTTPNGPANAALSWGLSLFGTNQTDATPGVVRTDPVQKPAPAFNLMGWIRSHVAVAVGVAVAAVLGLVLLLRR